MMVAIPGAVGEGAETVTAVGIENKSNAITRSHPQGSLVLFGFHGLVPPRLRGLLRNSIYRNPP